MIPVLLPDAWVQNGFPDVADGEAPAPEARVSVPERSKSMGLPAPHGAGNPHRTRPRRRAGVGSAERKVLAVLSVLVVPRLLAWRAAIGTGEGV